MLSVLKIHENGRDSRFDRLGDEKVDDTGRGKELRQCQVRRERERERERERGKGEREGERGRNDRAGYFAKEKKVREM